MKMSKLDSKIFEATEDRAEGEGGGEDEDGEGGEATLKRLLHFDFVQVGMSRVMDSHCIAFM